MQKTSVWGVVWWEDFHEEESEALLLVLHLCSDWPSSPNAPPYKCQARWQLGCLRHPGLLVRMRLAGPGGSIRLSGRPGERLSAGPGITVGCTTAGPAGWKG